MSMLDAVRANADAIRGMGRDAIEASRAAGFPAYYESPNAPGTMVRENPDGSLDLIPMHTHEDACEPSIPGNR